MNANVIILPIVIPLATGILSLLAARQPFVGRVVGVIGLLVNLGVAGLIAAMTLSQDGRILVLQGGDWPAPFGITIVVDPLAALMLATTALVLLATFLYCNDPPRENASGLFHPLFHLLALGVQWCLVAGDLFNLFVAFEIMLMASYALLVLGTSRAQMRQAYKYVLINLFGSTLFVTCCGLIYGHVGTLSLPDLARLSHGGHLPAGMVPVAVVLLLVFGLKTAIFPLWFWLPDAYPTMPAGLGGLFGGLLTKVGAYVMIRVFVMVFGPADSDIAHVLRPLLIVIAGVTMFLGVLGAVSMNSVRRILSIHIISQVGYMMLGVGLGIAIGLTTDHREWAVAGVIFFVLHNMVVKSSLFLCGGLMSRHAGSDELGSLGGLARRAPWLAALFLIAALSLAGLPPLSGFFAKFVLIRESMRGEYYLLAGIALATSVLTLMSMVKIWSYAFWSRPSDRPTRANDNSPRAPLAMTGTALLVLAALAMGLGAEHVLRASHAAARMVVQPSLYIDAVLGPDKTHPLRVAAAPDEKGVRP